ncbi:tyrosine-protein phosphatase [Vitreoscilla massiliensis]|uniref:Tyrosine-protein phosphatase n=1 Tax=Vitreoscilla massiliensis TaxID=1689272 RepID=A0ABY4E5G6_9NEIS|nr:protein-tyrosine phosphatase family protein [Vitreoscilla massiliensis]UOO91013.1 tyrosine-protein phosphatase [Vitreoscilla massiliensis]
MEVVNLGYLCVALALGVCLPAEAKRVASIEAPRVLYQWATPVEQSVNLFRVTPTLFRSEQLQAKDRALLPQNNIKTIINLRYFDRDDDQEELSQPGLKLMNHPLKSWRIKPKEIAAVLYEIEQAQKQGGVLVHCYHGADRTGLIIGMHRIVQQGWSIDEAKREMVEGPYGFHTVWRNIPKMYNQDTVNQVRLELARLRAAQ